MMESMTSALPDRTEALQLAARIQFTIISNAMTQEKWEDQYAERDPFLASGQCVGLSHAGIPL